VENAPQVEGLEGESRQSGELRQLNLFDQFHPTFNELVSEHSAPSAICGYVSCALARQLAVRLAATADEHGGRLPTPAVLALAETLRDGEALKPVLIFNISSSLPCHRLRFLDYKNDDTGQELRAAMAFVRGSRERWMDAHPADFPDDRSRRCD